MWEIICKIFRFLKVICLSFYYAYDNRKVTRENRKEIQEIRDKVGALSMLLNNTISEQGYHSIDIQHNSDEIKELRISTDNEFKEQRKEIKEIKQVVDRMSGLLGCIDENVKLLVKVHIKNE